MQPEQEHRINLSRRWKIVDATEDQESDWVDLPDLPLQEFPVRLSRKFNCPTGLDDTSIVCLRFTNIGSDSEVVLNQKRLSLSAVKEKEFESEDIQQQLIPFNELTLDVPTAKNSPLNICLRIKTGA